MKRKYLILKIILLIALISVTIYFHYTELSTYKKISSLKKYFSDNSLLDTSGNINLTSIKSELTDIKTDIANYMEKDDISIPVIKQELKMTEDDNLVKQGEITRLSLELDELNDKSDSLQEQYQSLLNKYDELIAIREAGKTYLINNFPTINQYPNYPTGCESVALTLLLRYYGINVSPDDVINNLSKGDLPYSEEGILYGGNPELHFIGNPYWTYSYGVYQNPIANVANIYKTGANASVGMPFNQVLDLVKENRPVVVWTSAYLAVPFISKSWIYKPTNETIYWKSNEHAVVLIGYNNTNVIISDPIGGSIKYQSRSVFEDRYNYYGRRVVYY